MSCLLQSGDADLPSLYVRHSTADKAPSRASTDFCITALKSQSQKKRKDYDFSVNLVTSPVLYQAAQVKSQSQTQ